MLGRVQSRSQHIGGEVSDTLLGCWSHMRADSTASLSPGGTPLLRDHLAARWGNVVLAENSLATL